MKTQKFAHDYHELLIKKNQLEKEINSINEQMNLVLLKNDYQDLLEAISSLKSLLNNKSTIAMLDKYGEYTSLKYLQKTQSTLESSLQCLKNEIDYIQFEIEKPKGDIG